LKSKFFSLYPKTLSRPYRLTRLASFEEGYEMRRANLSKQLYGLLIFACVICLFPVFPLPAHGAASSGGVWTATGSLTVARSNHTATLLPSGEVLVAGGANASGVSLSSSEIYNPSTGTWTVKGNLVTARQRHTATLLPNGKVLVTGGLDATGAALNSYELFDPSSGTWAAPGNFGLARAFHTATLLTNGKVLVAGGFDQFNDAVSFGELYDPSTGTWGPTGSLATARGAHTATLLNNGDVLAVGGFNTAQVSLSSCEIYDPSTGAWTATASLHTALASHGAALLASGDVLVAGGVDFTVPGAQPVDHIVPDTQPVQSEAEKFESQAIAWLDEPHMNLKRFFFGLLLWALPSLPHQGTVHQDQGVSPASLVLAVGGESDTDVLSSCEIFDDSTGKWTLTGSLATARYAHTATVLTSGKVLAAGGGTATGSVLSSCEIFASSSTTPTAPGAPTGVSATAGNADATVSFTAPASDGGSPITGYTMTSNPKGGVDANAGKTSTTHTMKGLKNGIAYTFTVTAKNKVGTGPASSPSLPVTPATVPGSPTNVTAAAGNAQATVSFKLPANGGSPIKGCTVTSKPGGLTGTGAGSPITVSNLLNGTAYTFTVTAANAIGTGKASKPSNKVTPK
jgi:hypothetical protein